MEFFRMDICRQFYGNIELKIPNLNLMNQARENLNPGI